MDYKWLIGVGLASTGSFISNLGVTLQKLHHIQSSSARAKAQHVADGTTSTQKLVVDGVASPSKSKASAVVAHAALPLSTVALSVSGSSSSSSSSAVVPLSPGADDKANYHKGTLWRVGLGLVIFGSFADFFALSFAPQSLIAPLGSLTLVSNVIFAPLLLKEKITARDLIATVVIVAGSVLAVSFASHEDVIYSIPELFSFYFRWPFLFYITGVLAYMGALYAFIRHMEHLEMQLQLLPHLINTDSRYLGYDRLRTLLRFAYPSISGAVGAQSVLFAKCTAELLMNTSTGNGFLFAHFQTYLVLGGMGLTIFLQIKWLNDGLRRFPASYTVPVFTAFWILLSVMSGLVFYNEYAGMHNFQMGMFAVGVLLTVAGVVTLSQRAVEEDFSEPEPAIEEEDVTDDEDALSVRLPETASVDGLIRHFSSLGSRTGAPGMVGAGPSPVATAGAGAGGSSIDGRPRSSSGSTTHNLSISVKVDNATGRLTTTVLSPTVNASAAASPNALVLSSA